MTKQERLDIKQQLLHAIGKKEYYPKDYPERYGPETRLEIEKHIELRNYAIDYARGVVRAVLG